MLIIQQTRAFETVQNCMTNETRESRVNERCLPSTTIFDGHCYLYVILESDKFENLNNCRIVKYFEKRGKSDN